MPRLQPLHLVGAFEHNTDRLENGEMSSQQHQRALLYKSLWHAGPWLLAVGIILVGANLRASITSVGPLIGLIKDSLHISNTLSGLLTTLPLLAFALLSPFVAKLSRRFGSSLIIFAALLLLTAGIVVRSTLGVTALFVGTAMLGLAIAVCNVLLPSLIKEEFPRNSGLMTGVYSVSMNVVAATASGLSIPLALNGGMGWRGALGIWAIIGVVGILLWVPQLLKVRRTANQAVVSARTVNVYKSSLAWKVTLFMGLQSAVLCSCCLVSRNDERTGNGFRDCGMDAVCDAIFTNAIYFYCAYLGGASEGSAAIGSDYGCALFYRSGWISARGYTVECDLGHLYGYSGWFCFSASYDVL